MFRHRLNGVDVTSRATICDKSRVEPKVGPNIGDSASSNQMRNHTSISGSCGESISFRE
jgi:hypothetical protein